jgi:opacity protein-like surface antigen
MRNLSCFGVALALTMVFLSGSLLAQDEPKIELIPFIGYTFSEGVNVEPVDIGNGETVDRLTPASALSYGGEFDLLLGANLYVGFNFSQQDSSLEARVEGAGKRTYTDIAVRNYHGILGYNFGDSDETIRPFFFGGLGATQYSPSDIQGQSVNGSTRFSTTWGGGVKYYMSDNVGVRFTGRWTPTYINSEASGIWCSPWWPWDCWVVGNANYSNQFELSGGLAVRF